MAGQRPKYSLHRATGPARVCIDGRDFYLGPHGSDESKAECQRLVDRWQLRRKVKRKPSVTIGELILLHHVHASAYYRTQDGRPTSEIHLIKSALALLAAKYSRTPVLDFGPRDLKRFVIGTSPRRTRARRSMHTADGSSRCSNGPLAKSIAPRT